MMEEEREMTLREFLSRTQADRFEEELTRPRVETWPDEWVDWIISHRKDQTNFTCHSGGRSSPFCPNGIH
jgi:hypothetical protein